MPRKFVSYRSIVSATLHEKVVTLQVYCMNRNEPFSCTRNLRSSNVLDAMWKDKNCGILNTYTEIGSDNFMCALWTSKQQFNLKMLALCRISIVLLRASLYCTFWNAIAGGKPEFHLQ